MRGDAGETFFLEKKKVSPDPFKEKSIRGIFITKSGLPWWQSGLPEADGVSFLFGKNRRVMVTLRFSFGGRFYPPARNEPTFVRNFFTPSQKTPGRRTFFSPLSRPFRTAAKPRFIFHTDKGALSLFIGA
ncbi:MAG: hypothetical protein IJO98_00120 [Clostridia bacterium]|nr:hypothetical protein [Clostridia bacterium]